MVETESEGEEKGKTERPRETEITKETGGYKYEDDEFIWMGRGWANSLDTAKTVWF